MDIPSTHLSLLRSLRDDSANGNAWLHFHNRYRPVVLAWCLRHDLQPSDAEDLTQDILLKLFQRLPEYEHDPQQGLFRSWLKTVVQNSIRDRWRGRARRPEPRGVGGTAFLEIVQKLHSEEAAEELQEDLSHCERAVAVEICERVKAKVNEKTWMAFYRTAFEGQSAQEVAQELDLSIGNVLKMKYRVKQHLKKELEHVSSRS